MVPVSGLFSVNHTFRYCLSQENAGIDVLNIYIDKQTLENDYRRNVIHLTIDPDDLYVTNTGKMVYLFDLMVRKSWNV